jgi:hypothetical protein
MIPGRASPHCSDHVTMRRGGCEGENVLAPVPLRQHVFTVPRMLRPIISPRRGLLGESCHIVERLLFQAYAGAKVKSRPGLIRFAQTFGDRVTFNPRISMCLPPAACFASTGYSSRYPQFP